MNQRNLFRRTRAQSVRASVIRGTLAAVLAVAAVTGAFVLPTLVPKPMQVAEGIARPDPPRPASALTAAAPAALQEHPPVTPEYAAATEPIGEQIEAAVSTVVVAPPVVQGTPEVEAQVALPPNGGPPLALTGTTRAIAINTSGYQPEIDKCLWVRMDIGAVAPIVGAHNVCGGDVVLAMQPGDIVTLTGEKLDGDYLVTGSRDAHPGDDAAKATAGLTAAVILQTCYWNLADGVRLVTLARIDRTPDAG